MWNWLGFWDLFYWLMINFYDYFMCSREGCIYSLIFKRSLLHFSTGSVLLCHANILFLCYLPAWSVSYRDVYLTSFPGTLHSSLLAVLRSSRESCLLRANVLAASVTWNALTAYAPGFPLHFTQAVLQGSPISIHPCPIIFCPLTLIYFFPSEHLSRDDTLNTWLLSYFHPGWALHKKQKFWCVHCLLHQPLKGSLE